MPAPIVMVHGAFCGGWVFERFAPAFEAAGHAVLCPDLRGHGTQDRADAAAGLSMSDYAQDVATLCAAQTEPPILIGHSLGGLVAQMAASRTPVRALVLLAPSPPWGVAGSSLEEAITALGVQMMGSFWTGAVAPDKGLMRTYSLDRMSRPDSDATVARLRSESGRALWETLNWWMDPFMTTSLGSGRIVAPSLAVVGERDVVHPPATVRQTAERIGAKVEILPGMSHWLPAEPGWESVVEAVQAWMARELTAAA